MNRQPSLFRQHVAALWLEWQRRQPWIRRTIPQTKVNYEPFKRGFFLPIEVAVFCPRYDAMVAEETGGAP